MVCIVKDMEELQRFFQPNMNYVEWYERTAVSLSVVLGICSCFPLSVIKHRQSFDPGGSVQSKGIHHARSQIL